MRTLGRGCALLLLTGCPESGLDTDTFTTGTGELSTGTTGGAPTTGSDTAGSGETGTTGEVDVCVSPVAMIPQVEFVSTFINTICGLKVECGCADDMCSVKFKDDLESLVLYAGQQGMVYDPECAAQTVNDYVTSRGCMSGEESLYPACGSGCAVYRGDIADGAVCDYPLEAAIYMFSDPCAGPETFCVDQVCGGGAPEAELKLGEVCYSDEMPIDASCEAGTECDIFGSETCEQGLQEGVPCLVPDGICEGVLQCSGEGVCVPPYPSGAPCSYDYECASFFCEDFACKEYVWICEVDEIGDLFGIDR